MDLFLKHPSYGPAASAPPSPYVPPRAQRRGGSRSRVMPAEEQPPLTVAEDAYRAERAYDVRRTRRRRITEVLRVLASIVAVPVIVAVVFVASYALTCVLDGASPEELVAALQALFERVRMVAEQALMAS